MRRFLLLFLFVACAVSTFAQAKHPFTFEDMMKLKRVGDPQVSPDGKWVIFSVVDVDLAANTKTPHVWIVPLSETQGPATTAKDSPANPSSSLGMTREREIIGDQDADRPRWAPDGKRFAFLSTKEGGSQIWVAEFDDMAGKVTGVHKLTDIATEASGELWSPDGKNILFTSDVYPECSTPPVGSDEECNATRVKEAESSKVKAQIFDHLLYRHWNAYKEGKRTHIFVTDFRHFKENEILDPASNIAKTIRCKSGRCFLNPSRYHDLTPGDYDSPVFSLGGQDDYAFSPDGKEICYTSNHDKNPAASTNNDLWIVPVDVGADAFVRPASGASADSAAAKPASSNAEKDVRSGEAGQDSAELGSVGRRNASAPTRNEYVAEVLAHTKNITADNPASDSSPLYSPDGRYIAYRAQQRPGYESDRFRLMLYDRKTGRRGEVPTAADLNNTWVGTIAWDPDSSRIYFVSEKEGESPISGVRIRPGFLEQDYSGLSHPEMPLLISQGFNDDMAVTPDGTTLLFTRMSIQHPTEIYKLVGKGEAVPLTHFNDTLLSQVEMSPIESFWFTGAHNDKVEGFLVKPPNFDASKKYPVKFLIHGGPEGAWGDDWSYRWNPELFASPTSATPSGFVVIMINFHGSTGYGQKFIDAINGDWGGAPFEDLMKGLDYAEHTYPFIDKQRECALGASYGGYAINWILGHTDRFKCLVSHDGMFNAESAWGSTEELWFNDWEFKGTPYDNRALYEKWSPHQYTKNFKTPTLVIHGQRDYRLDVSEGFQLFTTLQMLGVPSEMLYFPDEGHWVLKPQNSQLWYKTVNDWVDRWVGK